MPSLNVIPVPAFADNYLWLVQGLTDARRAAVVDPGAAAPVLDALREQALELEAILVTHHHGDHTGGVAELVERTGAAVWAPAGEPLPVAAMPVRGGDRVRMAGMGLAFEVLDVPGHTAGHVAYFGHGAVFCGDALFSAGCGRLFEGTAQQMFESLNRLAALPGDTQVYCAHEYTLANLGFALAVDPDNADLHAYHDASVARRRRGEPTVPSTVAVERVVNPFLRSHCDPIRRAAEHRAGRPLGSPVEVFAEIRRWKDGFR